MGGLIQAREMIRLSYEQRWGEHCVNWVKWVPWHKYKDDENADGDLPEEALGGKKKNRRRKGKRLCLSTLKVRCLESVIFLERMPEPTGILRGVQGV